MNEGKWSGLKNKMDRGGKEQARTREDSIGRCKTQAINSSAFDGFRFEFHVKIKREKRSRPSADLVKDIVLSNCKKSGQPFEFCQI